MQTDLNCSERPSNTPDTTASTARKFAANEQAHILRFLVDVVAHALDLLEANHVAIVQQVAIAVNRHRTILGLKVKQQASKGAIEGTARRSNAGRAKH